MTNNYLLFTSKLFTPFASMFDASKALPFLTQKDTFKGSFLAVFFWFIAVPTAIKSSAKKIANSAFMSQLTSFNHLLFSAAVEGRGGGGGGGHGGSRLRKSRDHDSFQVIFLRDIISNDYNLI
jgi:hypothetical protein